MFDFDVFFYGNKSTMIPSHFYDLYEKMFINDQVEPWSKCLFSIWSDGEFDVQFKMDLDYKWYKSLDADSQEFEDLDRVIIKKIKSWEGLPSDFDRYWLK